MSASVYTEYIYEYVTFRSQTYAVPAPTISGSVFMQRFRLFFWDSVGDLHGSKILRRRERLRDLILR